MLSAISEEDKDGISMPTYSNNDSNNVHSGYNASQDSSWRLRKKNRVGVGGGEEGTTEGEGDVEKFVDLLGGEEKVLDAVAILGRYYSRQINVGENGKEGNVSLAGGRNCGGDLKVENNWKSLIEENRRRRRAVGGERGVEEVRSDALTQLERLDSIRRKNRWNTVQKRERNFLLTCCCSLWKQNSVRRVCLILVIVLYSLLGGLVFYSLEKGGHRRSDATLSSILNGSAHHNEVRDEFVVKFTRLLNISRPEEPLNENFTDIYEEQQSEYLTKIAEVDELLFKFEERLKGKSKPNPYEFDYTGAVFYATTVFTTVGFGNIVCRTTAGQLLTVLYAFIGIPLMIMVSSDLGGCLTSVLSSVWSWCRRRRTELLRKGKSRRKSAVASISGGRETEDSSQIFLLPVLLFFFLYLFLCTVVFKFWEDWDYSKAFYYVFISFSTIGFGDVVPKNPRVALAGSLLFLMGLAIVSMGVGVVQQKIEAKYLSAMQVMEAVYTSAKREEELSKSHKKSKRVSLFGLLKRAESAPPPSVPPPSPSALPNPNTPAFPDLTPQITTHI